MSGPCPSAWSLEADTRNLLLALPLLLGACVTEPVPTTPRTVGTVDLQRYVGNWYEVARFPTWFQDSGSLRCDAVTATYTAWPDGKVDVVNRCRNGLAGGEPRVAKGTAYSAAPGNDRLRVSFFWPFYGGYWVIGLDLDLSLGGGGCAGARPSVDPVAHPADGSGRLIPTVEFFDRWYLPFPALRRRARTFGSLGVVPQARCPRDAGLPAGRVRGLGMSQSLVPPV